MLAETLKNIVEKTPGAKGAILMGFDGIAVMQHVAPAYTDTDVEAMAMEFSFRFVDLRRAAESLGMGDLVDVTIRAERGTFVVRCLSPDYFVALLLDDGAQLGRGRFMLRRSAHALSTEL